METQTVEIQQEIESVRASLTDKIEQIESTVRGTIEGVQDTVESTVDRIKASTIGQIQQNTNIPQLVQERPLAMVGAAVLAGYMLGSMEQHRLRPLQYELDILKDSMIAVASRSLRETLEDNHPRRLANKFEEGRTEREQVYQ